MKVHGYAGIMLSHVFRRCIYRQIYCTWIYMKLYCSVMFVSETFVYLCCWHSFSFAFTWFLMYSITQGAYCRIFIHILLTSIHLSLYDLHLRGPLKWALSSVLVWSSSPSFNLSLKDWAVTVTYFVTLSLCHACHSMSVHWVQNTCGLPRCRACRADPCVKPPVRQWFWNS